MTPELCYPFDVRNCLSTEIMSPAQQARLLWIFLADHHPEGSAFSDTTFSIPISTLPALLFALLCPYAFTGRCVTYLTSYLRHLNRLWLEASFLPHVTVIGGLS